MNSLLPVVVLDLLQKGIQYIPGDREKGLIVRIINAENPTLLLYVPEYLISRGVTVFHSQGNGCVTDSLYFPKEECTKEIVLDLYSADYSLPEKPHFSLVGSRTNFTLEERVPVYS